ncbi:MAG: hypothetical protein QM757_33610 [Paludibaculum sp.]
MAVKGVGLLKLVYAARLFGTSDAQDAFLAAFLMPAMLGDVLAAAAAPALIPALIRTTAEDQHEGAVRLYQAAYGAGVLAMSATAVILGLAFPILLPILAAGFGSGKSPGLPGACCFCCRRCL